MFRNPLLIVKLSAIFVIAFICLPSLAQEKPKEKAEKAWVDIGAEVQFYPAGFIMAARSMYKVSNHGNLVFRVGYNLAKRQNFGEHDNEEGGGPGLSVGYRYYFGEAQRGFFLAARTGFWFMNIDWWDEVNAGQKEEGKTFIAVVQPTIAGGYQYVLPNERWAFGISAAFGIEWNVVTDGSKVGQGGISILFLSATKRF